MESNKYIITFNARRWDYGLPFANMWTVSPKAPFTRYNLLSNGFDNRLNVCIHDTTGYQTCLTTGCIVHTTGCQTGCTTQFDNQLNEQLFVQHGCQTNLTTGLTTGCIM